MNNSTRQLLTDLGMLVVLGCMVYMAYTVFNVAHDKAKIDGSTVPESMFYYCDKFPDRELPTDVPVADTLGRKTVLSHCAQLAKDNVVMPEKRDGAFLEEAVTFTETKLGDDDVLYTYVFDCYNSLYGYISVGKGVLFDCKENLFIVE